MRIGIASLGRFHVLDLARELDVLGEEVQFHSYVPRKRAERFGLPLFCLGIAAIAVTGVEQIALTAHCEHADLQPRPADRAGQCVTALSR